MDLEETISRFLASLESAGRSAKTLTWYGTILRQYAAAAGVLSVDAVEAYLLERRRVVGPSTVAGDYRALRRLCNWCVKRGLLVAGDNPMLTIEAPSVPETIPHIALRATVLQLLAACEGSEYRERDRALVLALADTGGRLGEVLQMSTDNLRIAVRADGGMSAECLLIGKGGRRRRLLLGRVALQELERWLDVRPEAAGSVIWWSVRRGRALDASGVREVLRRVSRRAGLPRAVNPHSFRHGCAIDSLANGADLRTVQLLLGHSQITTTVRYLRLADASISAAHDRVSDARWGASVGAVVNSSDS